MESTGFWSSAQEKKKIACMQQRSIERPGWQAGARRMLAKKLFLDSKFADVVILKNRKLYQLPARQPQYITNHRERKLSGI